MSVTAPRGTAAGLYADPPGRHAPRPGSASAPRWLAPRLVERQRPYPAPSLVDAMCTRSRGHPLTRLPWLSGVDGSRPKSLAYSATVFLWSTVAAVKLAGINLGDLVLGIRVPA
jgi:hypothetical protein